MKKYPSFSGSLRAISLPICFLICYFALFSHGFAADNQGKELNQISRYIIKFNNNTLAYSNLLKSIEKNNITLEPVANNVYVLDGSKSLSISNFSNFISELKLDENIHYITEDRMGFFKPLPDPAIDPELFNDFKFNAHNTAELVLEHFIQWDEFTGPEGVFLESKPNLNDGAWRYSTGKVEGNKEVVVAVLDTGIESSTNLNNNIVKNPETGEFYGWNFSANNGDLTDETGGYHGTHVAGTIAGYGPNMLGMGPNLKILPVKIPDGTGMFYESVVLKSIYWAIGELVSGAPVNQYPAKVINMSFGIDEYVGKEVDSCSPAVQEAIDYARSRGVIMVVAAGNSNLEHDLGSPAGCKGTVRVASTGPTGLRSYFSNFGEGINFAAPGGDKKYGQVGGILSTVKDGEGINHSGLDFYQGTSMASPHVAGLAGLLFSLDNASTNYTAEDIEKLMYTTTHDFGISYSDESSCRGAKSCGHGIIDANNALQAAAANYNIIFSSPAVDLLGLQSSEECRGNLLVPTQTVIIKAEGAWKLDKESLICQEPSIYNHPSISIDTDNKQIVAKYGHVTYKLSNEHLSCNQIGYDGVGCYH